MHDICSFLRMAVSRDGSSAINGCYHIRGGAIYARNAFLMAGVEMPSEAQFSVPAEEFDLALSRMAEIDSLTVHDNSVVLRSGRLRSTIQCNTEEPPPLPAMPESWLPSPAGLANAIRLARPFLGDSSWTQAMRLMQGRVTALSNTKGIDITLEGLTLPAPVLITGEVADFLMTQGDPEHLAPVENALMFQWSDGRWLKAQLLNDVMPENVDKIFEAAGEKAASTLDEEWRSAYADAVALSDGKVSITPEGFQGIKGVANNDVAYPLKGLKKGFNSYWDAKVLDPVVAVATRWNLPAYPDAAAFFGEGFRGVVMGIKR